MSFTLPISYDNPLHLSQSDLGRGFAVDQKAEKAKKLHVFGNESRNQVTQPNVVSDNRKLVVLRTLESLRAALDVGPDTFIPFAQISANALGNYLSEWSSTDPLIATTERVSLFFSHRIASSLVEIKQNTPTAKPIDQINDLETLRNNYGLHYIRKIVFGSILDIIINFETRDKEIMKELKSLLSSSYDLAKLSMFVKSKTDGAMCDITVTSFVKMAGRQVPNIDLKSLDGVIDAIKQFQAQKPSPVPISIEISPLPYTLTSRLGYEVLSMASYSFRLKNTGADYWRLEFLVQQLRSYIKLFMTRLGNEGKHLLALITEATQFQQDLEKAQLNIIAFVQQPIDRITKIPAQDDQYMESIEKSVGSLIGRIPSTTAIGNWHGPAIKGDLSSHGEYVINISVNVNKVNDESFQMLYKDFITSAKRRRYYFMFMGMTGVGKTSMIEYMLNVLTGQVHAGSSLRAKQLESNIKGQSMTVSVCRYQIQYIFDNVLRFGIDLIDTPGFADTGGSDKDGQHINSILQAVSRIPELNSVSYVVPGSLTKNTVETISVLCSIFSVLPAASFNCMSTIVTFTDDQSQSSEVQSTLDVILPGIQHTPGVDNTEDLEKNMQLKSKVVRDFFLDRIRRDTSFSPEGMAELKALKDELLVALSDLGKINTKLHSTMRMLEVLKDPIDELRVKSKVYSLKEFALTQGFAVINGKPMAKSVGSIPWEGGHHSTGDNKFKGCSAFEGNGDKCNVCPSHCSFEQHIHTLCQLEWVENNNIASSFHAIKKGGDKIALQIKNLTEESTRYLEEYDNGMKKLSALKGRFKTLSVLGDIRKVIESAKATRVREKEIATLSGQTKMAEGIENIISEVTQFIDALDESETEETQRVDNRIKQIATLAADKLKSVFKKIFLS
eukprot:gene5729-6627_t